MVLVRTRDAGGDGGDGGFSLAEAMVMALAALAILAGAWAVLRFGLRQCRATEGRLDGVQGVHVLVEHLHHDVRRIYQNDGTVHQAFPIRIERSAGGSTSLQFCIFDEGRSRPAEGRIHVAPVRYDFDRSSGRVVRTGPEGEHVFPHRYERVVFAQGLGTSSEEDRPFPYLEYPPYRPLSEATAPQPHGVLTYQITCVPERAVAATGGRRPPADRTTVCGGILVPAKVSRERQHYWLVNWTSVPRP